MCFTCGDSSGGSAGLLKNRWRHDIFGKDRRPKDKIWIEGIREQIREAGIREVTPEDGAQAGAQDDLYTDNIMSAFIQLYSTPYSNTKELLEFVEGFSLDDLDQWSRNIPATAWLDDTCFRAQDSQISGKSLGRLCRHYPGFLTPTELRDYLKQERFDHISEPDADRRLIAIADLNPFYMYALAETVHGHQVDALKDALWKHFALRASLRCQTILTGYGIYKLELHIPYYALREYDFQDTPPSPPMGKQHRKWRDLTFLINGSFEPQQKRTVIHEAHISIVICGTDEKRWIAYCFFDSYFDTDNEPGTDEFSYKSAMLDQIAGGDGDGTPMNANNPIWDPLEYFLKVVCIRMRQIEQSLAYIVRRVENGVSTFIEAHPSRSHHHGKMIEHGEKAALDASQWTARAMESMRFLQEVLEPTNEAWKQFCADGDMDHFAREGIVPQQTQNEVQEYLRELKDLFTELKKHEDRLKGLQERCKQVYDDTSLWTLYLTAAGSRAAQKNGAAADLNILAVAPLQVACNLLAIPASVPLLKQDWKSLVILILIIIAGLQVLQYLLHLAQERIAWKRWGRRFKEQFPAINFNSQAVPTFFARLREKEFRKRTARRATEDTLVNPSDSVPV